MEIVKSGSLKLLARPAKLSATFQLIIAMMDYSINEGLRRKLD